MKLVNNTVLITGGSAGIGFEIARFFSENGNKVIITGRNEERLLRAANSLRNTTAIVSDVTDESDVNSLVEKVYNEFPELNILVNNAGRAFVYQLGENVGASGKAADEMRTNYLSIIQLTEKLLPLLNKQQEAAIVNVTSIVAIAPSHSLATYAASKAALHSYTQSLRITLERNSKVKVFELMPPLVDTEFSQEIGGKSGIPPSQVAHSLFKALENDEYEIHVGRTDDLYKLYLSSPADALSAMNPA